MNPRSHGFAYLFERYPSFTQTFCVREVRALRERGLEFPIFAIRQPADEPPQVYPACASRDLVRLPEKYDEILATDTVFRRQARKWQEELGRLWGADASEKWRIYEALWLDIRCRDLGISHVHIHFAGLAARTAFWLNRISGVTFSITAHANDIFRDEPPERLAQIFDAASAVVTVSDYGVRYLQEHFPAQAQKFHRVYNGIETRSFPRSGFPDGRPLILSVGRYIEKKGFADLVEACALLGARDFDCLLIGQGPLESALKEQAARLGLADKVQVAGPRTEEQIRELLGKASLFVLPCVAAADGSKDNLPTVIMEAMAAGLPVISTPVAGVPEMVREAETGWIVPEHEPPALAAAMARLLDDKAQAREFGRRGYERCLEQFDLSVTSAQLYQLFLDHGAFRAG